MSTTDRSGRRLFSSGKHAELNRQPWAIIREHGDGTDSVEARYQRKAEADADHGGEAGFHVEFDPIPWDSEPLTHPGNPILKDCHTATGTDWKAVDWWLAMLHDWEAEAHSTGWTSTEDAGQPLPHEAHALAVLTRAKKIFGPVNH